MLDSRFPKRMKRIYVCSRFAGDICKNVMNAKKYSRWIYKQGHFPLCVHIYLEEATGLHESKGDRIKLLSLGIEMLKAADEIWVFNAYGISEGMQKEIDYAHQHNIPVMIIPFIENLDSLIA
jgi:hypothetical protein